MTGKVGSVDRILRFLVGLAMMYGAYSGMIGTWGWLGAILAGTGAIRWCPVYAVLGINTNGDESEEED